MLVNGATVALNAQEDVILSDDGMSQLEYYFPFEYVESPEFLKDCTPASLLGDKLSSECQSCE